MPGKLSILTSVVAVITGVTVYRYPHLLHSGILRSTVVNINLNPTVDIGYAQYQGYVNVTANTTNFLGIRYAAAPVGDLRFAAPQTPSYISGVQPADKEPETCYQPAGLLGAASTNRFSANATPEGSTYSHRVMPHWAPLSGSEDCLFLNVFTPGTDLSANLPTVVWIHGGGYVTGGADSYYGPDLIDNAHGGVVVVIIQYRLGLFGFLAGKAVKEHGALNAGLLDQELALRWVKDNIHKFGGDPSKVTIWGESAGGGSVMEHVVTRGGKTKPPLFSGAIVSSPSLLSHYKYDDVIPEMIYQEAVTQANCGSAENSFACLRSANSHLLRSIASNIVAATFFGKTDFGPVIDGEFIVERPLETWKKGLHNGDAFLAIVNTNEGDLIVDPHNPGVADVGWIIRQYWPTLTPEEVSQAAAIYAPTSELNALQQSRRIITESLFACPSYWMLKAFGNKGYKGEFAVPPASHAEDLPYYFPTRMAFPMLPSVPDLPHFVADFAQSFASMIMSHNPNKKFDNSNSVPRWAPWTSGYEEMWFGTSETNEPLIRTIPTDPQVLKRCEFWEAVAPSNGH